MNINTAFDALSQSVWPVVRGVVGRLLPLSRRCSRCILSERHSPLVGGVCRLCLQYQKDDLPTSLVDSAAHARRLHDLLSAPAQGNQAQALLLLSGGKDSAYILHCLRAQFPALRLLAVFVDNGFASPFALRNAKHVAKKEQVELLVDTNHVEQFAATFKDAFLSLKGQGSYGVIDKADGDMIFDICRQIAVERGIPLMIGGLSWVQLEKIFGVHDFTMQMRPEVLEVYPLAAWRTDEQEIRKIVREHGLMLPGSDSPVVSNNDLIVTMSAIDVLNNGYCSFEPEFAQLIREGKTDRRYWLHTFEQLEFATRCGLLNRPIRKALGKLGITLEQVLGGKQ